MVCNTNDRWCLYALPDSIWIEPCPANWRQAFKAGSLRREVGGDCDWAHHWGTNGKYPPTALNDRTVIEMYSKCLQIQTCPAITSCHFIKRCVCAHVYTVWVHVDACVCFFVFFLNVLVRLWSGSIHLCVFLLLLQHFCCWVKENH